MKIMKMLRRPAQLLNALVALCIFLFLSKWLYFGMNLIALVIQWRHYPSDTDRLTIVLGILFGASLSIHIVIQNLYDGKNWNEGL